jgi:hypothetical protein
MSIEPASASYLTAMQHWQAGTPQSGPGSQASVCRNRTPTATGRFVQLYLKMLPVRLHRDKQRNSDILAELQPWLSPTRDSVGQEDRVIQIAEPNRVFSPSSVSFVRFSKPPQICAV